MNSIVITAEPRFKLNITLAGAECVFEMGHTHYDGVCRWHCHPDGFVAMWRKRLQQEQQNSECKAFIYATWHELDIVLKIMENISVLGFEQIETVANLRALINRAMFEARKDFNHLEITVT